jgi:hypothetical protein
MVHENDVKIADYWFSVDSTMSGFFLFENASRARYPGRFIRLECQVAFLKAYLQGDDPFPDQGHC